MFRGAFQGWHLVILIALLIILFGWKRLPDAARSLGRSMRIFKSEVDQMKTEGKEPTPSAASTDTVAGTTVEGSQGRPETAAPAPGPESPPGTEHRS